MNSEESGQMLNLILTDSGIGFSAEMLERPPRQQVEYDSTWKNEIELAASLEDLQKICSGVTYVLGNVPGAKDFVGKDVPQGAQFILKIPVPSLPIRRNISSL